MFNWWEPIQDLVQCVLDLNNNITAKTFIHENLYCARFEWYGNVSRVFWFPIDNGRVKIMKDYSVLIERQAWLVIKDLFDNMY